MTAREFCYWLQGFFELSAAGVTTTALTTEQTELVKRHLNLVFKHEIDPSAGGPEKQAELNQIHSGMTKDEMEKAIAAALEAKGPAKHSHPNPYPVLRC